MATAKVKRLKPNQIKLAIDTREQNPYKAEFERLGFNWKYAKLNHGDYTAFSPDLRKILAIERKSLPDIVACACSNQRERFLRELHCLKAYRYSFVVIEASLSQILQGQYRSKANPVSVVSSLASWQASGISFVLADTREAAALVTAKLIFHVANEICGYAYHICSGEKRRACVPEFDEPPHLAECTVAPGL